MMTPPTTDQVLRELGRRAAGLSPADIDLIVRESRQVARRARRSLEYNDLVQRLEEAKPSVPEHIRRRLAIHQAGHLVANLSRRVGQISSISIDMPQRGGWIRMEETCEAEATEDQLKRMLVFYLAGVAAEEQFIGNAVAYFGKEEESDLARANRLALDMETKFGFGEFPLLYLDVQHVALTLLPHRDLARRLNVRLSNCKEKARKIVSARAGDDEVIAEAFLAYGTLEGELLKSVVEGLNMKTTF